MLTVVTFTSGSRPRLLERCSASVLQALPEGAEHRIIQCTRPEDFAEARYKASKLSEFVAFVDDDDFIDPMSLKFCLAAIKESGAGASFTDEATVDLSGKVLTVSTGGKTYNAIPDHPRTIHHVVLFRSDCVQPKVLELDTEFNAGICWFIKACAALTGSAIYVPITGGFWTQHPQTSGHMPKRYTPAMSQAIRKAFPHPGGSIPKFSSERMKDIRSAT